MFSAPKSSKVSKVNAICDAFLAVLQYRMDTNLQNLVTAHVCKSPPDLEAGLELVAGLRGKSNFVSCTTLHANECYSQKPRTSR